MFLEKKMAKNEYDDVKCDKDVVTKWVLCLPTIDSQVQ